MKVVRLLGALSQHWIIVCGVVAFSLLTPVSLEAAPPQTGGSERAKVLESDLPEGAIARLGHSRIRQADVTEFDISNKVELPNSGHKGAVSAMAVSPRGDILASGGQDGQVIVWNWRTREDLQTISPNHRGGNARPDIESLAFSPDGEKLAMSGEGANFESYDWANRRLIWSFPCNSDFDGFLAFSTNGGAILASSLYYTTPQIALLRAFDGRSFSGDVTQSGKPDWDWGDGYRQDTNERFAVGFVRNNSVVQASSPESLSYWLKRIPFIDKKELPRLASNPIVIRNWLTGEFEKVLKGHEGRWQGGRFSQDGKILVTFGDDKRIRIWDVEGEKEISSVPDFEFQFSPMALSRSGDVLATFRPSKGVEIWVTKTGERFRAFAECKGATRMEFSPDNKFLFTGMENGTVLIWQVF